MVEETSVSECSSCTTLKKKIKELEAELHALKFPNEVEESVLSNNTHVTSDTETLTEEGESRQSVKTDNAVKVPLRKCDLTNNDIARYSRQILLPEINPSGQNKLGKASVLIVGVGGLGCPSALYLTAGGIGRIGLVDYDNVDLSNLQRQVLHSEHTENMTKVESAIQNLKKINSSVNFEKYNLSLSSTNCMEIIDKYDIVLDCSDNVATRYLLNDACIKGNKPLVSGSALRWEGQLTVYNYNNGPCYRCLYPVPPPAETVTNCSDAGVLGAITGVIGTLQALEAIKIITGNSCSYAGQLLMFDGLCGSFRSIKLRGKVKTCICACEQTRNIDLHDYEEFCGSMANDKEKKLNMLSKEHRISVADYYNDIICTEKEHLMLDVRPTAEFVICSLSGSVNIPLNDILNKKNTAAILDRLRSNEDIIVLCKVGNESQQAVAEILRFVKEFGIGYHGNIKDVVGGLFAWSKVIDCQFPVY